MKISKIPTNPIEGQRPGTSGLRKQTAKFIEPGFLENFTQATFNAIGGLDGKTLVLGGDGRYFNKEAAQTIIKMAAANGLKKIIVSQNALLSTPAASNLIRQYKTDGGIILSASHNPGGPDADFGMKFNISNGGPAPEGVTEAIYSETMSLNHYLIAEADDIDLNTLGCANLGSMEIEITDPIAAYCDLMKSLFDFDAIRQLFASGFRISFDAMHAVTGPYAIEILQNQLGAPTGSVINGIPSPDFGGGHPDPNPVWAHELMDIMQGTDAPDFGAASDGDGDRNMIVGRSQYVTPSDSLAVLAANAHLAPGYAQGLKGVARSMPTSKAVDLVAEKLQIPAHETPTGWKFFGNLLDADMATLCGEESAGTGSNHVREKDGLWAILLWLNILAVKKQSVKQMLSDHWQTYGRNYYSRHDYEGVDKESADKLMQQLSDSLGQLAGKTYTGHQVESADNFQYHDPVDQSISRGQGIRIQFKDGSRIVFRLSGTGTVGATLRIYLEKYEAAVDKQDQDPQTALQSVIKAAHEICGLKSHIGRSDPDVKT